MEASAHERRLTAVREEIINALRTQPASLFCILDAARDERILEMLTTAGADYSSLYEGPQATSLAQVAPYLVALDGHTHVLASLIKEGWGNSWGVFLTCQLPLKEVRRHFRHFLMVEGAGNRYYFRFYDPRVLRAFLPVCTTNQRQEFFGDVRSFFLEGATGELCQFTAS